MLFKVHGAGNDRGKAGVKKLFGEDWGEFVTFGNIYLGEVVQMGKSYAVVQINATYENTGITYTLMFDKEMKLCAFYVK